MFDYFEDNAKVFAGIIGFVIVIAFAIFIVNYGFRPTEIRLGREAREATIASLQKNQFDEEDFVDPLINVSTLFGQSICPNKRYVVSVFLEEDGSIEELKCNYRTKNLLDDVRDKHIYRLANTIIEYATNHPNVKIKGLALGWTHNEKEFVAIDCDADGVWDLATTDKICLFDGDGTYKITTSNGSVHFATALTKEEPTTINLEGNETSTNIEHLTKF